MPPTRTGTVAPLVTMARTAAHRVGARLTSDQARNSGVDAVNEPCGERGRERETHTHSTAHHNKRTGPSSGWSPRTDNKRQKGPGPGVRVVPSSLRSRSSAAGCVRSVRIICFRASPPPAAVGAARRGNAGARAPPQPTARCPHRVGDRCWRGNASAARRASAGWP